MIEDFRGKLWRRARAYVLTPLAAIGWIVDSSGVRETTDDRPEVPGSHPCLAFDRDERRRRVILNSRDEFWGMAALPSDKRSLVLPKRRERSSSGPVEAPFRGRRALAFSSDSCRLASGGNDLPACLRDMSRHGD